MTIKLATPDDAAPLIEMFRALYQESEFLLLEAGEFKSTPEEQENLIKANSSSDTNVLFVAVKNKNIIGFIGGTGGKFNRNRHSINIAMGVLGEYQRQGIGRSLLKALINWAKSHQFKRIELSVIENNIKAKSLYEAFGFEVEGLKQNSLIINGKLTNEYYMAKYIEA
ncbi:MAG: GNAT family N-acetyltransferase [gamma proteobacterium endosymbiont of Lamellibrachia anaximandri]|nr:GNAT family N-acetyltransferase [gamma proteobacterium endosymbiont of Lamellibrachia anaximandri]